MPSDINDKEVGTIYPSFHIIFIAFFFLIAHKSKHYCPTTTKTSDFRWESSIPSLLIKTNIIILSFQ